MQATESPPPIRENAPLAVASQMASAIALEPSTNWSYSNTPAGPFQRIVLHPLMASAKALRDSGPASKPSHPSGIALDATTLVSTVLPALGNSGEMTESVPRTNLTLFALAFLITSSATSSLFSVPFDPSSQIELPILPPCALANV